MNGQTTIVKLAEEFLLINLPIFTYVLIESYHAENGLLVGLVKSSEWCIGTVVMSFQALRLYFYGTSSGPKIGVPCGTPLRGNRKFFAGQKLNSTCAQNLCTS